MKEAIETGKKQKITGLKDLKVAIENLEAKKQELEVTIARDFHSVMDELKPSSIIKNTIREARESSEISHKLMKVGVALLTGYLSRKFIIGKSGGFWKKAAGVALQYGITALVAKKKDPAEKSESAEETAEKRVGPLKKILTT
jgi:hypothetical protein